MRCTSTAQATPDRLVWHAEESILPDTIYISHSNDIIRPPEARDPESAAYKNFVPAYNCSVVSNDATHGVSPSFRV